MSRNLPAFGFDVGGQSVKAVLASPEGRVLAEASAPTGLETTPDALADTLAALREDLVRLAPVGEDAGVGIGLAGVQDREGVFRGGPNLPKLIGSRLGDVLAARIGRPVVVHNDADCAAVAEGWGGAADGCEDYLLLTLGTGLGSGLVLGSRLRVGASGFGCEFGHVMVVHGGRRCGCGNLGCLEAYVSETAARLYVEEAESSLQEAVAARRAAKGGGCAESLFELGAAGNEDAERVAGEMVDVLGAAIGSAANVLDLTTFVIGGGIAPGALHRIDRLRRAAAGNLFTRPVDDLEIVPASRGPLAGAIGAARLAMLAR